MVQARPSATAAMIIGVMWTVSIATAQEVAEPSDDALAMVTVEGDLNGDGITDKAVRAEGTDAWAVSYGARADSDGVIRMDVYVVRDGRNDFKPGAHQLEMIHHGFIVWAQDHWDFIIASNRSGTYAVYNDGRVLRRGLQRNTPLLLEERGELLNSLGLDDLSSAYTQSDLKGDLYTRFAQLKGSGS
ncbi:MAG: hypothetical protein AAFS10_18015 [Myxococcota bacterium]